ncbi:XRE family transcriptional regulator [Pseudoalteromonas porphyrae]|uniref:response regulator transcription factor n=1 Tax=Pseudoalteromonas porphyrae TaxID=187330 RepID=UPI0006BAA707|nr:response regulator transcription factor [Pseudoalteromonas porphyrae]KPH94174.1 XRE family transcriptional regulator [Pseudoalteromonas porphyrae]
MRNKELKILVIEDNPEISLNIADYFQQYGTVMDFADNGQLGLTLAIEQYYDCIILDIMLPKLDGLGVCQQLRQHATRYPPIIMMTARDSLADKREGFELGADDYLTKPFDLEELWLRCNALVKRHIQPMQSTLTVGPLQLDYQTKQVRRDGLALKLQPIPWQIIHILMQAHPSVVSRTELCDKIWGDEHTDSDALRSHLYQLRKVIDKPFTSPLIKTMHGIGFCLDIKNELTP